MSKKIIFFDVDGTLVDVRPAREYVPESTIKAVRETRKKGNLCFLCTGRSLAEIYPHILDVGFDGIIGAGVVIAQFFGAGNTCKMKKPINILMMGVLAPTAAKATFPT